jgi:glycosyltransferase involved in cell wall biosynthesis
LLDRLLDGVGMSPVAERNSPLPGVAYFTRNLVVGGAERVYLNLVNNARRIRPIPVILRHRGGLLGELSGDLPLEALDAEPSGRMSADSLEQLPLGSSALLIRECRKLACIIDRHEITLVSSFLMRSHLVALLTKALLRPHIRVVINIHEHFSESARFLYPKGRDRVVARWVARHLFPRADRVVVVADEVRRDLISNFGLDEMLVRTLHNPLDVERIREQSMEACDPAFPAGDPRPTICVVGRLVYLKGHDILLHAIAALKKTVPVRLVIVGDGDERPILEGMVAQLGLQGDVSFVGWRSNPWSYVARSQLLVLSSRTEAFPSVVTEALALRVPVVAAQCSEGVRECLDGGRAGVLVAPGDPAALARGIESVLSQPWLAASLRTHGAKFVEQFRLPDAVAAYEDMLLESLAGRVSSPQTVPSPARSRRAPADV